MNTLDKGLMRCRRDEGPNSITIFPNQKKGSGPFGSETVGQGSGVRDEPEGCGSLRHQNASLYNTQQAGNGDIKKNTHTQNTKCTDMHSVYSLFRGLVYVFLRFSCLC